MFILATRRQRIENEQDKQRFSFVTVAFFSKHRRSIFDLELKTAVFGLNIFHHIYVVIERCWQFSDALQAIVNLLYVYSRSLCAHRRCTNSSVRCTLLTDETKSGLNRMVWRMNRYIYDIIDFAQMYGYTCIQREQEKKRDREREGNELVTTANICWLSKKLMRYALFPFSTLLRVTNVLKFYYFFLSLFLSVLFHMSNNDAYSFFFLSFFLSSL